MSKGIYERKPGTPRGFRCAVCKHPQRSRIEALKASGMSLNKLSAQFGVSRDAIHRHYKDHVTEQRKASYLLGKQRISELTEMAAEENKGVIEYLALLRSTLFFQLDKCANKGDEWGVQAMASRILDVLREIAKLTGELALTAAKTEINIQNNVAVLNSEPVAALQSGLLDLCANHPEIRDDVVRLLRDLDRRFDPAASPVTIDARPVLTCEPVRGNGAAHV